MEISTLTLPFLGKREYLHGTTLFDALMAFAPADAELSFKFSRMIMSNQVTVAVPDDAVAPDALLVWKNASGTGRFGVTPLPAAAPLERRAYPEESIADRATVEGDRIVFDGESALTFVSTLIPLHKKLIAANHVAEGPGQWVFTRLDISKRPMGGAQIELKIGSVFARQLVRSSITVDGAAVGSIYFSWLKK